MDTIHGDNSERNDQLDLEVQGNDDAIIESSIESRNKAPKRGLEDSEIENIVEKSHKRGRFELSDEQDTWELESALADYANKYINTFVPNQTLKDKILTENPVPSNVSCCKKLDSFMKEMLLEQNKNMCLSQEKSLANLQQRIEFVYGPLSKVWSAIESEKVNSEGQDDDDSPIVAISSLFEQTMLLLGQAVNTCAYVRRFNILMSFLNDRKKVETILKDNASAFTEANEDLFGEKYEDAMVKSSKSKKKSKEFFGLMKNSSTSASRKPFSRGPLSQSRGGRGRGVFSAAGQSIQNNFYRSRGGNFNRGRNSRGGGRGVRM